MNLVIVDDHNIFRQSLAMLLGQQDDFRVLADCGSLTDLLGNERLRNPEALQPDCILLDYHLPGENPVTALNQIRRVWPQAHVAFLTGTRQAAVLRRILQSGVEAVLHKNDDLQQLLTLLRGLTPGETQVSPVVASELQDADFGLTAKEFDVLALLTAGQTPVEIADRLSLSKRTVEKHKENIMRKTGVHNLAQLVELGHRLVIDS